MLYILIIAGVFVLDYQVKNHIETSRELRKTDEILGGKILIRKYYNKGAFLNILENRQKLLNCFTGIVTGGLLIYELFLILRGSGRYLKLGLAFLIGGSLSNLYDRVIRGYVIDYFSFASKIEKLKRVVFNISDMFILFGALIVSLWSLLEKK